MKALNLFLITFMYISAANSLNAQNLNAIPNPPNHDVNFSGYEGAPIVFNDTLFLNFKDSDGIMRLHAFDGNTFTQIPNPPNYDLTNRGYQGSPVIYNSNLYLRYCDNDFYCQMYRYENNGLTVIPNPPGNTNPGNFRGYRGDPFVFDGKLYLRYKNNSSYFQMYEYDGQNLTLIPNPPNTAFNNRGYTGRAIEYDNKMYVQYYFEISGIPFYRLYSYDGQNLVEIPNPPNHDESFTGYMGAPVIYQDTLYLRYRNNDLEYRLYAYDGQNLTYVANQPANFSQDDGYWVGAIEYNGSLLLRFRNTSANNTFEVYEYDGSTFQLIADPPNHDGNQRGYVGSPFLHDNKVFGRFRSNMPESRYQLFTYDGSDYTLISPPTVGFASNSSGYYGLPVKYNDDLYFKYRTDVGYTKLMVYQDVCIVETQIDTIVCFGDEVLFDGVFYSSDTTISKTYALANDCDSIVTFSLTVLPEVSNTISAEICTGDSYDFDGLLLSTDTILSNTFVAANGCDSIVTLTLTVLPEVSNTISAEICSGDSYDFDGTLLSTDTILSKTFVAANGCDSVVILTLTVLPEFSNTISAEICTGDSYDFDGLLLSTDTILSKTFVAANGCDSIVTLTLTVLPEVTNPISAEICTGDSYDFDGLLLSTDTVLSKTFVASNGCDSIVTLTLTVLTEFSNSISAEICTGDSYDFDGLLLSTDTVLSMTYVAANGCDSIVTLTLTVLPEVTNAISAEICTGDSYDFDGTLLSTDTVLSKTYVAANGCDSIVTLTLTVLPEITNAISAEICSGDSYNFDGLQLSNDTILNKTFIAANGCDSTVTLNLSVLSELTTNLSEVICSGEQFDFDGLLLDSDTLVSKTYTSTFGCDSTVNLQLSVLPEINENLDISICEGEVFEFDGLQLEKDTILTSIFTAVNGCDSLVTLNLSVTEINLTVSSTENTLTAEVSDAQYQWIDCDNENAPIPGAVNQEFMAEVSGNYACEITYNGCTSVTSCTEVIVVGLSAVSAMEAIDVYPNPSKGVFTIKMTNADETFSYTISDIQGRFVKNGKLKGEVSLIDLSEFRNSVYLLTLYGKDSVKVLRLVKF